MEMREEGGTYVPPGEGHSLIVPAADLITPDPAAMKMIAASAERNHIADPPPPEG